MNNNSPYTVIVFCLIDSLIYSCAHGDTVRLTHGETVRPAWLDQTQRPPPPAQSQEAINKLINTILSGDNTNKFNPLNPSAVTGSSHQQEDIGPLSIANSSRYWSWHDVKPRGSISDESEAKNFLDDYENEAEKVYSASVEAGWNYFTNLTEYNRKKLVRFF